MSAADEDTELRDLVAQTLHQQGVLSKIKAQLRSSIFLALDEHEQGKLDQKTPLVNQKLKKFLQTTEGVQAVSVIRDFLEYFDLDYTLSVFEPELNHIDQSSFTSSEELRKQLHNIPQTDAPILVDLLNRGSSHDQSHVREKSLSPKKNDSKPDPPSIAPAANFIDLEESLDRKESLFSYEESPRSPRKPQTGAQFVNLAESGDSISLGGIGNEATKSQLFDHGKLGSDLLVVGGAAGGASEAYEDDFGSSANSINLPKSSRSKTGAGGGAAALAAEKSEVSEDLDEDVEEELDEDISEVVDEVNGVPNAKNTEATSDHSVSRISDTEADLDYAEDVDDVTR